jgi:hypothetical protein
MIRWRPGVAFLLPGRGVIGSKERPKRARGSQLIGSTHPIAVNTAAYISPEQLPCRPDANDGRGRDGDCSPPPAQIRTCGFPAYGSYLGWVTANRFAV